MPKSHIFLKDRIAESLPYIPKQLGGGNDLPERNRFEHADNVRRQYEEAVAHAKSAIKDRLSQNLPVADGVYLKFDIRKDFLPSSLPSKEGVTLLKTSLPDENGNVDVTFFVEDSKETWFTKRIDKYEDPTKDTAKAPRYASLIQPIENVETADILDLYTSSEAFDFIPEDIVRPYEVWIAKGSRYDSADIGSVFSSLNIGYESCNVLSFDAVDIWLVNATKQQLRDLPMALGLIEGIRPYHAPSVLKSSHEESRIWSELIRNEIALTQRQNMQRIGLLDSGVNNAHILLSSFLPDDRLKSVIAVADNIDRSFHGTSMAGLALFGDLSHVIHQSGPIEMTHDLASVKIFEEGHSSEFYGVVIEEAISESSAMKANIMCLAVTDQETFNGEATSSSSALDLSIYNQGKCDRLVVVSAGNVEINDVDSSNPLESTKANAILSPAQAWNALTVGAYTEKCRTDDTAYTALASPGAPSPYTRSSYSWHKARIKPDIVLEGGNVAYHPVYKNVGHDNLSLMTTSQDLNVSLESFYATSAATALAARLAARIKAEYPNLSMLSVRALMVHSAQWTSQMKRIGNIDDRMSICGYGVPNEYIALRSDDKYATVIFENEIVPFKGGDSGNTVFNEFHFYDMPWPVHLFETMNDELVRIRITLSYYVEPSPGEGGWRDKYRYPSASLRFDLKTATETRDEFLRRYIKSDERALPGDSKRWAIGIKRRKNATVQSDWIECTASELAACNQIAVFPGRGWWKERKLANVANRIKYSLIISIESSKTEIYEAVKTAINNKIAVQV